MEPVDIISSDTALRNEIEEEFFVHKYGEDKAWWVDDEENIFCAEFKSVQEANKWVETWEKKNQTAEEIFYKEQRHGLKMWGVDPNSFFKKCGAKIVTF
jgi:hypothetical protein